MYNIFDKINQLQSELSGLKISDKDQRRLDEKFRLEFNYNSNHMEGNTLTYQDTKVLLLKDILPQGKLYEMRELDEMRAHDAAFEMIKEWAADKEREISETDIKNLHKIILVKNYWNDAKSLKAQKSRKEINVGNYKESPNHVELQNGEIFHYAEPIEVPAKMQELMEWYQDEKDSLHPITLAAVFHHKFVLIHPFDDGNGRISRLLMNYILIRQGYPPVVIKSANKDKYLNALRLADAGDMESFITYMAEQAEWSLETTIKAVNGVSIEEANDWEKEITLLSKNLKSISVIRNFENTNERIQDSVIPLFKEIRNMAFEKFLILFKDIDLSYVIDGCTFNIDFDSNSPNPNNLLNLIKPYDDQQLYCSASFYNFINENKKSFDIYRYINVRFDKKKYMVYMNDTEPQYSVNNLINKPLSNIEISEFVNEFCRRTVGEIKKNIEKL